jgi:WD40 repeat protein
MRDGKFLQNLSTHNSVINSLAVNEDGVCASGGDDGTLHFTDYQSGYNFQKIKSVAQPGNNYMYTLPLFYYYNLLCHLFCRCEVNFHIFLDIFI